MVSRNILFLSISVRCFWQLPSGSEASLSLLDGSENIGRWWRLSGSMVGRAVICICGLRGSGLYVIHLGLHSTSHGVTELMLLSNILVYFVYRIHIALMYGSGMKDDSSEDG
ncbi:hypothetical protein BKA93DRAFT_191597 [Sparassis latifolia]